VTTAITPNQLHPLLTASVNDHIIICSKFRETIIQKSVFSVTFQKQREDSVMISANTQNLRYTIGDTYIQDTRAYSQKIKTSVLMLVFLVHNAFPAQ
jgi:hypothetical protein